MSITLTWKNPETPVDSIVIFRSVDPFDEYELPEPHRTLPGDSEMFVDEDVDVGATYHYRIGVERGGDVAVGELRRVINYGYTGPGPQKLLTGDDRLGYYGTVGESDFISSLELLWELLPERAVDIGTNPIPELEWHKLIIDAKVLFIPSVTMAVNVTWEQLYARGLINGDGNEGSPSSGVEPVLQNARINVRDSVFSVRLPRGTLEGHYTDVSEIADSGYVDEYSKIFYALANPDNVIEGGVRLASVDLSTQECWMQDYQGSEKTIGTTRLTRSGLNSNNRSRTAAYGWRPILEYLPNQ